MKLLFIFIIYLVTITQGNKTKPYKVKNIEQVDSLYQTMSTGSVKPLWNNSNFIEIRNEKFIFYAENKNRHHK